MQYTARPIQQRGRAEDFEPHGPFPLAELCAFQRVFPLRLLLPRATNELPFRSASVAGVQSILLAANSFSHCRSRDEPPANDLVITFRSSRFLIAPLDQPRRSRAVPEASERQ